MSLPTHQITKKITERLTGYLGRHIEDVAQIFAQSFVDSAKGVQESFKGLTDDLSKSLRTGIRWLFGELVPDPYIRKTYSAPATKFAIDVNQISSNVRTYLDLTYGTLFSGLKEDPKKGIYQVDKIKKITGLLRDGDYYLRNSLAMRSEVETGEVMNKWLELKKAFFNLEPDERTAFANIFRDYGAKLAIQEAKLGKRVTLETIYPEFEKTIALARQKGYIERIEKDLNTIFDEPMRLEQFYYPQISPAFIKERWNVDIEDIVKKGNIPLRLPSNLKQKKEFYEKARHLSPWEMFEDPEAGFRHFHITWAVEKEYERVLKETLADTDILGRLTKEELQAFVNYIGNLEHGRFITKKQLIENGLESIVAKLPIEEEGIVIHSIINAPTLGKLTNEERFVLNQLVSGIPEDVLRQMGLERRFYFIPVRFERWMKKYLDDFSRFSLFGKDLDPAYHTVRLLTTTWKKYVTMFLNLVPFPANNLIGDSIRVASYNPEAFKALGNTIRVLRAFITEGLGPGFEKRLAQYYTPQQIARKKEGIKHLAYGILDYLTHPYAPQMEKMLRQPARSPVDWFSILHDKIVGLNQIREMIPKLTVFLNNLERVEKGLLPIFRGAPKYITELWEKGYVYEALAGYARYVTVDYAAIHPTFRRLFSNVLFPFAYWYLSNFRSLVELSIKTKGAAPLLAYITPIAIANLFNNQTEKLREYDKKLPDWVRYSFHINFEVSPTLRKYFKNKEIITLQFETPWDIAARFVGIDRIWRAYENWQKGQITDEFFRDEISMATFAGMGKQFENLLNPVLKAFLDIRANRDSFTGRKIVDEHLLGTPQSRNLQVAHFLDALSLTPAIPLMGITNQADLDYILKEADLRGAEPGTKLALKTLWEVIQKGAGEPAIKRAFGIREYDFSGLMSKAVYEPFSIQKRNTEDYCERILRSLERGDIEEFRQRVEDIKNGDAPGIEIEQLDQFFARPTTVRRLLRRIAALKLPPEERQKFLEVLRIHELIETIKKMPRAYKNDSVESLMQLYEALNKE